MCRLSKSWLAVGDKIEVDSGLITLETDKATMDVPSPFAGVVKDVKVAVGDSVARLFSHHA